MRISIGQIIILLLIIFLLFGDFKTLKKKLTNVFRQLKKLNKEKNRKKGT